MTPTNPSSESLDADARVRAEVRRANDLLAEDDAPSPAVRAAVLAAAARQVNARPQPVGARPRWRVPLAAAASVLVGALAVMLASRYEEPATRTVVTTESAGAPAAPGAAPASSAPAPAADSASSAPVAPPITAAQRADAALAQARQEMAPPASTAATREELAVVPAPAPATAGAAAAKIASESAAPMPPVAAEARRQAAPARDAAAPAAIAQGAPRAKDEAPASTGTTAIAPPAATGASERSSEMTSNRMAPPPAAPAPRAQAGAASSAPATPAAPPPAVVPPAEQQVKARPVQRTAPTADGASPAPAASPLSAEEANRWITRIVELRRAGRDAEADAELKALRERAPTLAIPPEALPRAGTR